MPLISRSILGSPLRFYQETKEARNCPGRARIRIAVFTLQVDLLLLDQPVEFVLDSCLRPDSYHWRRDFVRIVEAEGGSS